MRTEVTDLAALKDLLLWARKERIVLSQVSIGNVTVLAQDMQIGEKMAERRANVTSSSPEQDAYQRYGGDLLKEASQRLAAMHEPATPQGDMGTYEDEDDA